MTRDTWVEEPVPDHNNLSQREKEILYLLATGVSNKEIAVQLHISPNTVKVHVRNIFAKTGTASRTEAAIYAMNAGMAPSTPAAIPVEEDEIPAGGEGAALSEPAVLRRDRTPAWFVPALVVGGVILAGALVYMILGAARRPAVESPAAVDGPPAAPRWEALTPMPTARYSLATAAFETGLVAIGGQTADGVTDRVERYDVITGEWRQAATKPTPAAEIGAAVLGGKIYVPGGRLADGAVSDRLEVYDPVLDRWQPAADLPVAVSAYALAAFEGRLYLIGGWDGSTVSAAVYSYDPQLDHWTRLANMPTARAFHGAAIVGRRIYVIGGFDGRDPLDVSEVFSPDSGADPDRAWSAAPALPDKVYGMGVAGIADIVYAVGGVSSQTQADSALAYFEQPGEWRSIEAGSIQVDEMGGLTALGTNLFLIGGRTGDQPSPALLLFHAIYTISFPLIVK